MEELQGRIEYQHQEGPREEARPSQFQFTKSSIVSCGETGLQPIRESASLDLDLLALLGRRRGLGDLDG